MEIAGTRWYNKDGGDAADGNLKRIMCSRSGLTLYSGTGES